MHNLLMKTIDLTKGNLKLSHTVWPNDHLCKWCLVDVNELFFINMNGDWVFGWFNLHHKHLTPKSRCCGRCDGVNDICVTDMVCEEHKTRGCEICYGARQ